MTEDPVARALAMIMDSQNRQAHSVEQLARSVAALLEMTDNLVRQADRRQAELDDLENMVQRHNEAHQFAAGGAPGGPSSDAK